MGQEISCCVRRDGDLPVRLESLPPTADLGVMRLHVSALQARIQDLQAQMTQLRAENSNLQETNALLTMRTHPLYMVARAGTTSCALPWRSRSCKRPGAHSTLLSSTTSSSRSTAPACSAASRATSTTLIVLRGSRRSRPPFRTSRPTLAPSPRRRRASSCRRPVGPSASLRMRLRRPTRALRSRCTRWCCPPGSCTATEDQPTDGERPAALPTVAPPLLRDALLCSQASHPHWFQWSIASFVSNMWT
mmetsp:Transcript_92973/g.240193  ORF Transcript_92973/g.240193 Transcript_92973/m.240193 type:complete len:248 (-) Transcript_92973:79-822(-)